MAEQQPPEPETRAYEPRVEDVLVLFAQVPERAADVLAAVDAEQLRHRHAPALPTLTEAIEHLAGSGRAFDALVRSVVVDGAGEVDLERTLHPSPGDAAPPGGDEAVGAHVDDFARDRRRTFEQLRGLDPGRWQASIEDHRHGTLTLLDLVKHGVHHETAHVTQLRNLLSLLPN